MDKDSGKCLFYCMSTRRRDMWLQCWNIEIFYTYFIENTSLPAALDNCCITSNLIMSYIIYYSTFTTQNKTSRKILNEGVVSLFQWYFYSSKKYDYIFPHCSSSVSVAIFLFSFFFYVSTQTTIDCWAINHWWNQSGIIESYHVSVVQINVLGKMCEWLNNVQ